MVDNNIIINNNLNKFEFPSHVIQAASFDGYSKDSLDVLCLPENHESVFSTFLGKEVFLNNKNIEFKPETGSYYALKNLFTILAGRFQSSAPITGLQSEVLSTDGGSVYQYIINNVRHLGLEVENVDGSPLFMIDDKVVPANGNYHSVPSVEEKIDGQDLINSMAFSKLIEELPSDVRWDSVTGIQNQGNQPEALSVFVNALDGVKPNTKVMMNEIMKGQEVPLKSVRNVIKRLEKLELIEYHTYHGGYIFKPEVDADIEFLKTNWNSLKNGEVGLIGIRSNQFPGETEAHRDERVTRTNNIITAYNDFVVSKNIQNDDPLEFTATELLKFIKTNKKYSEVEVTPADLQVFIRRLTDSGRGAVFEEEEFYEKDQEREKEFQYTRKEYMSACKKAIPVDEKQVLLFRRIDFSKQPLDWNGFIESLETNNELETSYRLALYLHEKSGLFVTKEELKLAMSVLCVECDKKGFHSRYMDAQDPEKNLAGYVQTKGPHENSLISRINSAFIEANEYAQKLAQNQPLMQEMFERNILNPGNPKMGELTGLHKLRENAAKVLVDYLVSYRKDS